jgi:hypothetical protein
LLPRGTGHPMRCAHCARKDSNADVNDRYPVLAGA